MITVVLLVETVRDAGDAAVAMELFLALAGSHVIRRHALGVGDVAAGPF